MSFSSSAQDMTTAHGRGYRALASKNGAVELALPQAPPH